jgi:hypothetical protein
MKTKQFIQPIKAAIFLIGILVIALSNLWAQANNRSGKSVIKVRAIYDDNERPVRRAEVTMQSEDLPPNNRRGVTDAKGEVIFNNVAPGSYTIIIGFAGVTNGSPGLSGKSSATVDETSRSEVTIRAKRGGALTGKITYPDGEPVIGAKVTALVKRRESGSSFLQPVTTDDRGIYRIYPLSAGEYIVSAVEEGITITELPDGGTSQSTTNMSVAAYYYGGGNGIKSAQVIQLEAGRELGDINITLTDRALFKVSGTVVGAGEPLAGASLSLSVRNDGDAENTVAVPYMGTNTQSDNKGAWSFNNVPEGNYYIEVTMEQPFNPANISSGRIARRFAWQPYPINVSNGDIDNIVVAAAQGARVNGAVVVEGDKPIPHGEISLRPSRGVRSQFWRDSIQFQGGSKGEFKLDGVAPGEYFFMINVWDRNYYVKSITWSDRDLLRFPLTFGEGNEFKGVRIVLATDISDAKGRLVYADNRPVAQNIILVVPVDESRWPTSNFNAGYTDRQGNFRYRGAPGEYVLIVMPRDQEPNRSPGYFQERMTNAPRVTLKPGEQDLNQIVVPAP